MAYDYVNVFEIKKGVGWGGREWKGGGGKEWGWKGGRNVLEGTKN